MSVHWKKRYASRTECMRSSAIRDLLTITEQPEFISFAGGLPAPELFPVDEVAAASERVLGKAGRTALPDEAAARPVGTRARGDQPLHTLIDHSTGNTWGPYPYARAWRIVETERDNRRRDSREVSLLW